MTTIYLINNTLTMNNLDYPDDTLELLVLKEKKKVKNSLI